MAANYKRLMELLKRWPVDKTKKDRDYGLFLRELVKSSFPSGNIFPVHEAEQEAIIDALYRIADNKYKNTYGAYKQVGASGLTLDQLRLILSENFANKYLR